MQGLDFHRTMKGVLEFLRLRDEMKKKETRVQMSYLELKENASDTQAFREFWEPKVKAIEVWKPHNFGDGRDYRNAPRRFAQKLLGGCATPRTR